MVKQAKRKQKLIINSYQVFTVNKEMENEGK